MLLPTMRTNFTVPIKNILQINLFQYDATQTKTLLGVN